MPNGFVWTGVDELKQALRTLPADLTAEASAIVIRNAETAAEEIRGAYPRRTGDLKDHVAVSVTGGGLYVASARVKNTAKLAWIFENGTQARHTKLGANRGSMPPGHVFIPVMQRRRRVTWDAIRRLLVRYGLVVSGDA